MKDNKLIKINQLIEEKKISEAHLVLSRLGPEFLKNPEYLYLRSRVFYLNKLFYIAIDTLLIALEFKQEDKFYILLSEIYKNIDNKELSKKLLEKNSRFEIVNSLKDELSGIYRKR